jgi:hypothetical protein
MEELWRSYLCRMNRLDANCRSDEAGAGLGRISCSLTFMQVTALKGPASTTPLNDRQIWHV